MLAVNGPELVEIHPAGTSGQAPGMSVTPWDRAAVGDVGHTVGPGTCCGCRSHRGSGWAGAGLLVTPWVPSASLSKGMLLGYLSAR